LRLHQAISIRAGASGLPYFVIALISLAILGLMYRLERPTWQKWMAYATLDFLITWIIFGANVLS